MTSVHVVEAVVALLEGLAAAARETSRSRRAAQAAAAAAAGGPDDGRAGVPVSSSGKGTHTVDVYHRFQFYH